jgi:hypothetical protein
MDGRKARDGYTAKTILMILKDQIQAYLEKKYSKTRWPNVYLSEIMREFGPEATNALNDLAAEGIVRPGKGINGMLVIYTEDQEEIELNKKQFAKKQS